MRALYLMTAVAGIVVFVLGVKSVIPTPNAVAASSATLSVMEMQATSPALPVLAIRDMTFALD